MGTGYNQPTCLPHSEQPKPQVHTRGIELEKGEGDVDRNVLVPEISEKRHTFSADFCGLPNTTTTRETSLKILS